MPGQERYGVCNVDRHRARSGAGSSARRVQCACPRGSTWMVIDDSGNSRRSASSRSSHTACESSTLIVPGTRRLKSRSEEHTSELQSLMRNSYAVFCVKKKQNTTNPHNYRLKQRHTK